MHFHGVIRAIGDRASLFMGRPNDFPFTMTSINASIHGVTAVNFLHTTLGPQFCGIYIRHDCIRQWLGQRLDMNFYFLRSTRRPLACDLPVGWGEGKAFKRSCTRSGRMGRTVGRDECEPAQTRLPAGMSKHASGAAKMSWGSWEGPERHFSHGRASGRLHLSRIRYQNIVE